MGAKKKSFVCPKCKKEFKTEDTIGIVKKEDCIERILTRLCIDCYYDMLDFIDADDVEI